MFRITWAYSYYIQVLRLATQGINYNFFWKNFENVLQLCLQNFYKDVFREILVFRS